MHLLDVSLLLGHSNVLHKHNITGGSMNVFIDDDSATKMG